VQGRVLASSESVQQLLQQRRPRPQRLRCLPQHVEVIPPLVEQQQQLVAWQVPHQLKHKQTQLAGPPSIAAIPLTLHFSLQELRALVNGLGLIDVSCCNANLLRHALRLQQPQHAVDFLPVPAFCFVPARAPSHCNKNHFFACKQHGNKARLTCIGIECPDRWRPQQADQLALQSQMEQPKNRCDIPKFL
jgi:hypothetical protein